LFRLLGWWSIDEGSREEQARLYFDQESGLVSIFQPSIWSNKDVMGSAEDFIII